MRVSWPVCLRCSSKVHFDVSSTRTPWGSRDTWEAGVPTPPALPALLSWPQLLSNQPAKTPPFGCAFIILSNSAHAELELVIFSTKSSIHGITTLVSPSSLSSPAVLCCPKADVLLEPHIPVRCCCHVSLPLVISHQVVLLTKAVLSSQFMIWSAPFRCTTLMESTAASQGIVSCLLPTCLIFGLFMIRPHPLCSLSTCQWHSPLLSTVPFLSAVQFRPLCHVPTLPFLDSNTTVHLKELCELDCSPPCCYCAFCKASLQLPCKFPDCCLMI